MPARMMIYKVHYRLLIHSVTLLTSISKSYFITIEFVLLAFHA